MPDDSGIPDDPGSPDSGTAPGLTSGPPGGGAVGATGGAGAGLPPQGAPGAQPNLPLGAHVDGFRRMQLAIKLIETTLPMFGVDSKQGKVVIKLLNLASKEFGADGSRAQDPMDAVMRRQMMAQRATPPQGPPGAGGPAMPSGMGGPPGGGPGPLPTPNTGPVPMPKAA